MAWDAYDIDDEGAFVFKDAQTGKTLRTAPTPFAQDFAKNLDAARSKRAAARPTVDLGEIDTSEAPQRPEPLEQVPLRAVGTVGGGTGDVPEAALRRGNLPERPETRPYNVSPPPVQLGEVDMADPDKPRPAPAAAADPGRAVRYGRTDDGGFEFTTAGGSAWRSVDSPAARELARYLDRTAPLDGAPRGPQNPGDRWYPGGKSARADNGGGFMPPAPIIQAGPSTGGAGIVPDRPVIQVAPSTGGNPFAPPAPLVDVGPSTGGNPLVPPGPAAQGAPPTPGNALVPPAPEPTNGAPSGGAAPTAPPSAKGPGGIIFTPGMDTSKLTPEQLAAYTHYMAGLRKLRGSSGHIEDGGTFPTGSTEQYSRGPDPRTTISRERAQDAKARVDDALANVASRRDEELAEHQQEAAGINESHLRRLQDIHKRESAKLGEIFDQVDKTQKELSAANVDPDRLVNGMSTGRQIGVAIAMGLGAWAQAVQGDKTPPMAMQVFRDAIDKDIEAQKYAIEKKRGDLNALGQTYRLALDKFGNEKMASDAARLAGLNIIDAKIRKTVAEADAAQGVETQWVDGKIVAGPHYSMNAQKVLAENALDKARIRESLSQAMNGQVAQQFVTTQSRVVGAVASDEAGAAKEFDAAAKSLGGDEQQQVMFQNQRYKLGKFAESGEGKQMRSDLVQIEAMQKTAKQLAKYLEENPIGSRTYDKSKVDLYMEELSSGTNAFLGQGAKTNPDSQRYERILSGVFTNGIGAVRDLDKFFEDQAQRRLDQLNAKPTQAGGGFNIPKELQDYAAGKGRPSAGGPAGLQRSPATAHAGPILRSSGATASPLDRATAGLVQTRMAPPREQAAGRKTTQRALDEALNLGQLDRREHELASEMLRDGQYDELGAYLNRRGSAMSAGDFGQPMNPAVSMLMTRAARQAADDTDDTNGTTTVTVSTSTGKGKGKAGGGPKAGKVAQPNLMPRATKPGKGKR